MIHGLPHIHFCMLLHVFERYKNVLLHKFSLQLFFFAHWITSWFISVSTFVLIHVAVVCASLPQGLHCGNSPQFIWPFCLACNSTFYCEEYCMCLWAYICKKSFSRVAARLFFKSLLPFENGEQEQRRHQPTSTPGAEGVGGRRGKSVVESVYWGFRVGNLCLTPGRSLLVGSLLFPGWLSIGPNLAFDRLYGSTGMQWNCNTKNNHDWLGEFGLNSKELCLL